MAGNERANWERRGIHRTMAAFEREPRIQINQLGQRRGGIAGAFGPLPRFAISQARRVEVRAQRRAHFQFLQAVAADPQDGRGQIVEEVIRDDEIEAVAGFPGE